MYNQPFIFPLSPAILGIFVRSIPLLSGVPYQRYSVIVPLHNKANTIEKCINSILSQTKKPSQIIVIDDCSTDNSYQIVEEKFSTKVLLVRNEKNLGKAQSINKAIQFVEHPFTLIVDADTYLEDTFAHHILKGFYNRRVKGCCGLVLPTDEKTRYTYSRRVEHILGFPYKLIQTKIHGIWVLSGCSVMFRTFFLRQNPIPDRTVVEDMDVTWQAQSKKDYKGRNFLVNFNPKAVCYTEEPQTFKSYLKQIERWFSSRDVLKYNLKKSKLGLKIVCLWLFGEFFSYLGYSIFLLYSLLTQNWLSSAFLLSFDFTLTLSLALFYGKKLEFSLKTILKAIPSYYLLRPINTIMFLKCLLFPKKKW